MSNPSNAVQSGNNTTYQTSIWNTTAVNYRPYFLPPLVQELFKVFLGETVLFASECQIEKSYCSSESNSDAGYLFLTDRRICIIICDGQFCRQPYRILANFDYKSIATIGNRYERIRFSLTSMGPERWIDVQTGRIIFPLGWNRGSITTDGIINWVRRVKDESRCQDTRTRQIGSFPELKRRFEENNIMISSIRCCLCGGAVPVPGNGMYGKCPTCSYENHIFMIVEHLRRKMGII